MPPPCRILRRQCPDCLEDRQRRGKGHRSVDTQRRRTARTLVPKRPPGTRSERACLRRCRLTRLRLLCRSGRPSNGRASGAGVDCGRERRHLLPQCRDLSRMGGRPAARAAACRDAATVREHAGGAIHPAKRSRDLVRSLPGRAASAACFIRTAAGPAPQRTGRGPARAEPAWHRWRVRRAGRAR